MRQFSTVELLRDFKTVTVATNRAPVKITQHRKPRYVLMSVEDFEKLARRLGDPRRAYGPGETPPDLAETLLRGLDRLITEDGDGR